MLVAATFAYPALLLATSRVPGFALGAALLASCLGLLASREAWRDWVARQDRGWLAAIAAFLVVGTLDALWRHAPTWFLANHARLLGVFVVYAAIRTLQPSPRAFLDGCSLGALAAASIAVWQCGVLGLPRAQGPEPPFGQQLATIFAGLSVILAFIPVFHAQGRDAVVGKLAAIGLAGGLAAAVLSGSRGAWIAAAVLAVVALGRHRPIAAFVGLLGFVIASATLDVFASRWSAGLTDLVLYGYGHAASSLGIRIELWKAAVAAFEAHPWMGLGADGFHAWLVERQRAGLSPAVVLDFDHAHSEALHALATGGIVRLAALAAAIVLPAWHFLRIVASRRSGAAWAALAVIIGFVVVGVADSFFIHRAAITTYVVFIVWLGAWAGIERNDA